MIAFTVRAGRSARRVSAGSAPTRRAGIEPGESSLLERASSSTTPASALSLRRDSERADRARQRATQEGRSAASTYRASALRSRVGGRTGCGAAEGSRSPSPAELHVDHRRPELGRSRRREDESPRGRRRRTAPGVGRRGQGAIFVANADDSTISHSEDEEGRQGSRHRNGHPPDRSRIRLAWIADETTADSHRPEPERPRRDAEVRCRPEEPVFWSPRSGSVYDPRQHPVAHQSGD